MNDGTDHQTHSAAATTLWIDATAGVAGDMLLGALIDAGAPVAGIQAALDAVAPGAIELRTEEVARGAMRATHARVLQVGAQGVDRTWAAIRALLEQADLAEPTRRLALDAFRRIAVAEAHVHGMSVEDVHFHEVGGLDAIGDVVGTCEALRLLGVERVLASWVALGNGRVRAAHGWMPVPAPAVLELTRGWQVRDLPASYEPAARPASTDERSYSHDHDHPHVHHQHDHEHHHVEEGPAPVADRRDVGELATPTGLALVRALAEECTGVPACAPQRVGVGAGAKDLFGWANVVRAVLLVPQGASAPTPGATSPAAPRVAVARDGVPGAVDVPATALTQVEANIDDLDGRLVPGVIDDLLSAGAADAWATPIHMKKGRPALTLAALVDAAHHDAVVDALLRRTTTLGVRETLVTRTVLERAWRTLDLDLPAGPQGLVVKIGHRDGVVVHAQAEFSSLAALAATSGLSELDLAQRAAAAIATAGLLPGAPLPSPTGPTTGATTTNHEEADLA